MSNRSRSTIKSSLFTTDPLSTKDDFGQNQIITYPEPFLTKGSDSSSFSLQSSNDNLYVVKSKNGTFKFNRNEFNSLLEKLKDYEFSSINNLSSKISSAFNDIVTSLNLINNSEELYKIILEDIKNVFLNIEQYKPASVGAFFTGCLSNSGFKGPIGCNPRCVSSLAPNGNTSYANCEDFVLIYSDGYFNSLNEKTSSHAYIYIDDEKFRGFTSNNIKQLAKSEIDNVTLIFGNKNGSYRDVTERIDINKLPLSKNDLTTDLGGDVDTSIVPAVVVIVILIIIIVALILVAYFKA